MMGQTVRNLLNRKGYDLWSISPDRSVYEAIALMAKRSVGSVIVLDRRRLVGILTERDYARKVVLMDRSSRATRVEEIMTRAVTVVGLQDSVEECRALMTLKRIRHLPVVDAQLEVVGMISIGDVLKSVIRGGLHHIDQLERYIMGSY